MIQRAIAPGHAGPHGSGGFGLVAERQSRAADLEEEVERQGTRVYAGADASLGALVLAASVMLSSLARDEFSLKRVDMQRQFAIAGISGKPMPLSQPASLMKADYGKLTAVVKASGMTPQ